MRIAVLHSGDLNQLALGGIDQYIKSIIRHRGDNEITLFGTCVHGKYVIGQEYYVNNNGLSYTFIPVSDDSVRPLTKGYILNELKFIRKIAEYDVIYVQRVELTLPFAFSQNARSKLVQVVHGSSYYTTLHMNRLRSVLYYMLERISIIIAKKTLIVLKRDEFGVPYYKRRYKQYSEKIDYTKIPVDTNVFRHFNKNVVREELELPSDKYVIMYGGRVENNPKRVLLFPDILIQLNKNERNSYFLVVVGSGTDCEKLGLKLNEYKLNDSYRMVSYIEDRTEYVKYLNASNVNINLSEYEGTCTSSLEAVSCGTPLVSTNVGDIQLIVRNGQNGFTIANSNDKQIIHDTVEAIHKIRNGKVVFTDDYKQYECKNVIDELFSEFEKITSFPTQDV